MAKVHYVGEVVVWIYLRRVHARDGLWRHIGGRKAGGIVAVVEDVMVLSRRLCCGDWGRESATAGARRI